MVILAMVGDWLCGMQIGNAGIREPRSDLAPSHHHHFPIHIDSSFGSVIVSVGSIHLIRGTSFHFSLQVRPHPLHSSTPQFTLHLHTSDYGVKTLTTFPSPYRVHTLNIVRVDRRNNSFHIFAPYRRRPGSNQAHRVRYAMPLHHLFSRSLSSQRKHFLYGRFHPLNRT